MPEHYFRTIRDRRTGTEKRIIEFQDEQYDLVAAFITTEADRHHREILKVLEEVLAGDQGRPLPRHPVPPGCLSGLYHRL